MNNTPTAAAAASPPPPEMPSPLAPVACPVFDPAPVYVVPYASAHQFVLALTVAGLGVVLGLTAIAAVLVVVVRRLNVAVGMLRQESGAEVRGGLLNGKGAKGNGAANNGLTSASPKKKKRSGHTGGHTGGHNDGTSCADEPEDEEEEEEGR
tara:strand:+ start:1849 stop:2304 length:456 start_codon:yes stop_codon:yes gene_type:complete